MRVFEENGIIIQDEERILIDPHGKKGIADKIFVSHAHSDHVNIGAKNPSPYFMSIPTHGFIEHKIPKSAITQKMEYDYRVKGKSHKVSLVNAGHILGSSQVVVEGEKKVCVTSDFKLQNSIIQPGAEIVPCNILVIESTFGIKQFSFPERETIYQEIGKWVNEAHKKNCLPVLAGYATGKAQELTKIVNEYTSFTPYVHEFIFEKNKIFERYGKSLGEYVKIEQNARDAEVVILPPSLCSPSVMHALHYSARKRIVSAKATGWPFKEAYDNVFPLSDHADFSQLMEYVSQAQPKMVYTMHGYDRELAQAISKELHIPAKPLHEAEQMVLAQY